MLAALGLAAFYLATLVRALPGVRGLVRSGIKPFACDVCMSAWCALAVVLAESGPGAVLAAPGPAAVRIAAAAGVAFVALAAHGWAAGRLAPTGDFRPPEAP
jgi:hypothetical protein